MVKSGPKTDSTTLCLLIRLVIGSNAFPTEVDDEWWYLDSGAGCHFMGQRDALTNIVTKDTGRKVCTDPGDGIKRCMTNNQARFKLCQQELGPVLVPGPVGLESEDASQATSDESEHEP